MPEHEPNLPGVYDLLFKAITREIDATRNELKESVKDVADRQERMEIGMASFSKRLVDIESADRDALVRRETRKALRRQVTKIVLGASGVAASIATAISVFLH